MQGNLQHPRAPILRDFESFSNQNVQQNNLILDRNKANYYTGKKSYGTTALSRPHEKAKLSISLYVHQ